MRNIFFPHYLSGEPTKPARKTICRSHKRNPEADKAQNRQQDKTTTTDKQIKQ